MLRALGAEVTEVRRPEQMAQLDGLVLPGGESTVMGKLLAEWQMLEPLRAAYARGMALLGTCAGLILLCTDIENSDQPRLGLLNATVKRNAFGRQVDSFEAELAVTGLPALTDAPLPAVFIRAPVLTRVGENVEVLAREAGGNPVMVRQGRILGLSFHPELTTDLRVHRAFLHMLTAEGCEGAAT